MTQMSPHRGGGISRRILRQMRESSPNVVPDVELRYKSELAYKINELKKERNAVVLGHNYMEPALYNSIPDFTGRLPGAVPPGGPDYRGHHRLLRRALHGGDREDPQSRRRRCSFPSPVAGLFPRAEHHRGGRAGTESAVSRACPWSPT